jgi:aminoglycoside phosphotransferase (APT) family kinase protein
LQRSVAHWVDETRRRREKLSRVDDALAERAARIAGAIEAGTSHQATRALSLIHGDFHPDQIWIHDGRVVLFDFDEFTLGDPMEDLAEFMLKLDATGATAARVSGFVAAYAQAAPQRFDARSLDWHLAIQQLLQASRAFTYQQPGWRVALQSRLAGCESRLATLS